MAAFVDALTMIGINYYIFDIVYYCLFFRTSSPCHSLNFNYAIINLLDMTAIVDALIIINYYWHKLLFSIFLLIFSLTSNLPLYK